MERIEELEVAIIHLFRRVEAMNAQVSALATQVAATVAEEGKVITALGTLKAQIATLQADLAKAVANGFDTTDVAALTKAVSDLSASATALAAA